jgi:hypothetical protein
MNAPLSPLHERLAKHALTLKALSGLGGERLNRISIKDSRFTLMRADGLQQPSTLDLDCIIVDANPQISRQWFLRAYDPAVDVAPDCFSHNGVGPSMQASNPQCASCAACIDDSTPALMASNPQCASCAACQWSQDGSAVSKVTGKPVKACPPRKLLAVLPLADAATVYQLNLPVTSLSNFQAYAQGLATKAHPSGRPFELFDLVTRVSFDTSKGATVGKLVFAGGSVLEDAHLSYIADLLDTGETVKYIKTDDKAVAGLPAPSPMQQVLPPEPSSAPVQQVAPPSPAPQTLQAPAPITQAVTAVAAPAPLTAAVTPSPVAAPVPMPTALSNALGKLGF